MPRTRRHHPSLLISHDLAVVRALAHDLMVEAGSTEQLFEAPQHAYTRDLLVTSSLRPLE
ncbi:hypothetical protein [Pseudomonas capeferrum]